MSFGTSTLSNLAFERKGKRKRESSWDRTGGNSDYIWLPAGQSTLFAAIKGAGCINHIWLTLASQEEHFLRKCIIRMYWDGEQNPSVETPIGDFFGLGHAMMKNFSSLPLQMCPDNGRAFNCWFAMPFAECARLEVLNECREPVRMYFYVDYESYAKLTGDALRFHAWWNRECPTTPVGDEKTMTPEYFLYGGKNLDGAENYLILDAKGKGHYVGCHLDIHNRRLTDHTNWYGEGDDMIFVDGEKWPPSLHGTGTEDYFNTAWCPREEICYPYHGIILGGGPNWIGKVSLYRYHIEDPVMFDTSIRVSIEHGHNNQRYDDWSSTAYWYQTEPHLSFPALPAVELRLPLPDIRPRDPAEMKKLHRGPAD